MKFLRVPSSAWLLIACLTACDEASDAELPAPTTQPPAPVVGGEAGVVAVCDGLPDGTACGPAGGRTHCIFSACVKNACGDGVAAEAEECDDGDEINGDGCSDRCTLERCGNGTVDLGEQCDDGNAEPSDGCTPRCKLERCGNRVSDPGEECDDGNTDDADRCSNTCKMNQSDAGPMNVPDASLPDTSVPDTSVPDTSVQDTSVQDTSVPDTSVPDTSVPDTSVPDTSVPDSSLPDGGKPSLSDACVQCVTNPTSACRTFEGLGVDFPATCFENADPVFNQLCKDAYECSMAAPDNCMSDVTRGAISCYCGLTTTLDDCFAKASTGLGPKGLCMPQWEAASGCADKPADTRRNCVSDNFGATTQPSAYAAYMIKCAALECTSSCL